MLNLSTDNLHKTIDINEKRLSLLNFSKVILERPVWANVSIQVNFLLANLYANQATTLVKSSVFCDNIIMIYTEEPLFDKSEPNLKVSKEKLLFLEDNIYLIETLNLLCDIFLINKSDDLNYDLVLDNSLKAYKMIWQYSKPRSAKLLKLKFDCVCRLCCIYRKLKMPKECLEILMEGSNRFAQEFQKLQTKGESNVVSEVSSSNSLNNYDSIDECTQMQSSSQSMSEGNSEAISLEQNGYLIQYMEYLFLINRKIAIIHMKHAIESNLIAKNKDLVEKSFFLGEYFWY